jgi:hypothetical protein
MTDAGPFNGLKLPTEEPHTLGEIWFSNNQPPAIALE